MPLYEYYCADCQTTFEALRPMSKADTPIECKSCQSQHTSRALSLFAAPVKDEGKKVIMASGHGGGGCCSGGTCGCH